jgi:ABC-2 type transport system ATP-binding protein
MTKLEPAGQAPRDADLGRWSCDGRPTPEITLTSDFGPVDDDPRVGRESRYRPSLVMAEPLERTGSPTREEPRPLVIENLTKRYSKDVLAVDRLSVAIDEGSVFGLLGPNGAGKTTTMRMLLGLVRPDDGRISIFDQDVTPGAPVLETVGALVETPGFVPFLSGLKNLELYWKAGSSSLSEANIDEVLAIAALGDAIHRKFKTYSQGMRQRLAIAQSLLGHPRLLVLDEPTNGLDPQQTREVRSVIRRAAASGTTVLLSSHLLSEVEQLCDHAAVINQGRLVKSGPVADLVSSRTTVYLEVDNVATACSVLERLTICSAVVRQGEGISLELNGAQRKDIVTALVGAGVGVQTITARHGLEDAYIELLGGTAQ